MSSLIQPVVSFFRLDRRAILPHKGTDFSVGYDLTAIGIANKIGSKTILYHTGLALQAPQNFYIEIVPRSSLIKTGYILANSIGIIDNDYRGEILIALTKIDDAMPDLTLPFTKCQLILRRAEYYGVTEIFQLDETTRGDGGFGSTDNLPKTKQEYISLLSSAK